MEDGGISWVLLVMTAIGAALVAAAVIYARSRSRRRNVSEAERNEAVEEIYRGER